MSNETQAIIIGSSLRMRGAPGAITMMASQGRIIPADAGSTGHILGQSGEHADHPCGCGEHRITVSVLWMMGGSSLRMRGAPARKPMESRTGAEDHPCGCGEHLRFCSGSACRMGSSLRMRGARACCVCKALSPRIIPADAGST